MGQGHHHGLATVQAQALMIASLPASLQALASSVNQAVPPEGYLLPDHLTLARRIVANTRNLLQQTGRLLPCSEGIAAHYQQQALLQPSKQTLTLICLPSAILCVLISLMCFSHGTLA